MNFSVQHSILRKMGFKELCMVIFLSVVFAVSGDSSPKKFKVVCYLGSWANYRTGGGKFVIEDIDPNLCTHLIYGFAKLVNNQITPFDAWLDLKDNSGLGAYSRFNGLKKANPQLKTLIAIGGWSEESTKYSQMASSAGSRATFVKSVVDFCKKYDFDGLDVDWEYPANGGGAASDKENFATLLKELKEALEPKGLLLSAAVAAGKNAIDTAYDIPKISQYLDFINVMAYDFHGSWEPVTGMNAPLHATEGAPESEKVLTVKYAIDYWINKGAPSDKLVMGMGIYGRSFTLANPSKHELGAPTAGPGNAGPMTKEAGMLGYNEICLFLKQGWNEVFVPKVESPYAFSGNQWVGYDNVKSIDIKVDYLIKEKLGGGMIWSLETDDFRGNCGGGKYPLLSTISKKLSSTKFEEKRETETSTLEEEEDEDPEVTPKPGAGGFECSEAGFFRDPSNCSLFYRCVKNGEHYVKFSFDCPPTTAFDEKNSTCNHKHLVPGC